MPFQLLSSMAIKHITVSDQQTSKKGQKFCTIQINGEQPLWQLSSEPLFSPFQAGVFQKDSATETRQNLVLHLTDPARETLEAFDTFFCRNIEDFCPKSSIPPSGEKTRRPELPMFNSIKSQCPWPQRVQILERRPNASGRYAKRADCWSKGCSNYLLSESLVLWCTMRSNCRAEGCSNFTRKRHKRN